MDKRFLFIIGVFIEATETQMTTWWNDEMMKKWNLYMYLKKDKIIINLPRKVNQSHPWRDQAIIFELPGNKTGHA